MLRPSISAGFRRAVIGSVKIARSSRGFSGSLYARIPEDITSTEGLSPEGSASNTSSGSPEAEAEAEPEPEALGTAKPKRRHVHISPENPWEIAALDEAIKKWRLVDVVTYFKKWQKIHSKDPSLYSERILERSKSEMARRKEVVQSRRHNRVKHAGGRFRPEKNSFDRVWLRDSCDCSKCVDPSTKQKTFQTTDIPFDIEVAREKVNFDGSMQVTWAEEVPGTNSKHVSTYSKSFLSNYHRKRNLVERPKNQEPRVFWDKTVLSTNLLFSDYDEYLSNDDVLYKALEQLRRYGLMFLRGIPDYEDNAVETIGNRIGNLRDTFYGRTWDVKSVPQAKNVAYTNLGLGFHMDLLYMNEPPGYQLLHCIRNSCEGGDSLFSDTFHAVQQLHRDYVDHPKRLSDLYGFKVTYHYDNAGQHYRKTQPLLVSPNPQKPGAIMAVNYSPPFQAPWVSQNGILLQESVYELHNGLSVMKDLANRIEDPENVHQYKLQEGECVIFNNRRIVHARSAFDMSSGERWLKGAYVDTDVFDSRLRVLHDERNGVPAFMASMGLTEKAVRQMRRPQLTELRDEAPLLVADSEDEMAGNIRLSGGE